MKWIFSILFISILAPGSLLAGPSSSGNENIDPEQQQLEWCFVYSNLLGYNIQYIANPRLYETVSQWLGTPYKFSGENENGVDCSGFVCRLFKASYDLQVNGCSIDLYKASDPVKKEELREGDLVFFKIRRKRITHVGVYLGQNKFAHASSHSGVIVSDLSDPYYLKYFYSGGRIRG